MSISVVYKPPSLYFRSLQPKRTKTINYLPLKTHRCHHKQSDLNISENNFEFQEGMAGIRATLMNLRKTDLQSISPFNSPSGPTKKYMDDEEWQKITACSPY